MLSNLATNYPNCLIEIPFQTAHLRKDVGIGGAGGTFSPQDLAINKEVRGAPLA